MPAALTLILICPSPGSGSGTWAHFSTSGGPYPVITTALGMAVLLPGSGPGWAANGNSECSLNLACCSIDEARRQRRRLRASLAEKMGGGCWRPSDAGAGATEQGQRAQGSDDGGNDARAAEGNCHRAHR